ncbi:MAG TPA: hypothetical protein VFX59_10650 [Polyangiales bacterium]|nr:hypothetical protein [Polyangiales bacterium]
MSWHTWILLGLLAGCTTHQDDLRRANDAFSAARYEEVEVWLYDLEPELGRMSVEERAGYFYLAGMSAYRIGHRARAKHALALCREESLRVPGFSAQWLHNMHSALDDLEGLKR